jgi:transposase-like protein
MSYPVDVKEKAFQLYVQGASFDEIRDETNVNKKTLLKWKRNEGWEARRDKILEDVKDQNDEKAGEMLTKIYDSAVDLHKQVLAELKEGGIFRTKEGAVAAYMQLTNLILRLQPSNKELKVGDVLDKVLKVLFDHPKIGIVLDKYKDEIVATINKELSKPDAERRVTEPAVTK